MNDIDQPNRQMPSSANPTGGTNQKGRTHRQQTTPSPESHTSRTVGDPLASLDLHQTLSLTDKNKATLVPTGSVPSKSSSVVATPGAGNSNSLPGHQSNRSKVPNPQAFNLSDTLNSSGAGGDPDAANSSLQSSLLRKKHLSTSDLDPSERKKQAALAKVEAKLEKAQRLHQKAQQSVEQEISDFLRVTAIPNTNNEGNSSRTANTTYDKRIRTLQDTRKELEKKIATYHSDISRIQAGEIPHTYSSSKDILSNIKSTAAKVTGGSLKHRTVNPSDQTVIFSTPNSTEQGPLFQYPESDTHHQQNTHFSPTLVTQPTTAGSTSGAVNNNQNLSSQNQYNHTLDPTHMPLPNTTTNEVGNSQFYIDSSHEHVFEADKSNRKYDVNLSTDATTTTTVHDHEKSPLTRRRLTGDSTGDFTDRTSDHSGDDRQISSRTKRNASATNSEYQQLSSKIESLQKLIDRYEAKMNETQKQIDSLTSINDVQRQENERLNGYLSDSIILHQTEMSSVKTDLKNLEERLLYKFKDYWNELLEKIDKLDTRTAKVEQTQTHSLETEENTHRIISKLVNILLTVFAIILLILSTIKNLVQSRLHAMTLLILVTVWITFHYLPENYFQTTFLKNFPNMFKRG